MASNGSLAGHVLDGVDVPPHVFSLAIAPEAPSHKAKLDEVLSILCREDPSLTVVEDEESGQTLLRGLGELHLEVTCQKLADIHNVPVVTGEAYVAYRESLEAGMEIKRYHLYDRLVGPEDKKKRVFAAMDIELTSDGSAAEPTLTMAPDARRLLSAEELDTVHTAFTETIKKGPHGYPLGGLTLTMVAIEKDADSTPAALAACLKSFLVKCMTMAANNPIVLEPVMLLEIETPEAYVGEILGELTSKRRATIKEIGQGGENQSAGHSISAEVPLARLLGYATTIRSTTQGEGEYSLEYLEHRPVELSDTNIET